MRDEFVADIGDFCKYGLLLDLISTDLRLGIVWYHFPDKEAEAVKFHGSDYKYLFEPEKYKHFNEGLFENLKSILDSGKRTVRQICESGPFPNETVFHLESLSYFGEPYYLKRRVHRRKWFQRALDTTHNADIVFLDPDNGLEVPSRNPYHHELGPKYISYDELLPFMERGQTLVIYQHTDRSGSIKEQIQRRKADIMLYTGYNDEIHHFYFTPGSRRFFLVIPALSHKELLIPRIQAFKQSAWKRFLHFHEDA